MERKYLQHIDEGLILLMYKELIKIEGGNSQSKKKIFTDNPQITDKMAL